MQAYTIYCRHLCIIPVSPGVGDGSKVDRNGRRSGRHPKVLLKLCHCVAFCVLFSLLLIPISSSLIGPSRPKVSNSYY